MKSISGQERIGGLKIHSNEDFTSDYYGKFIRGSDLDQKGTILKGFLSSENNENKHLESNKIAQEIA